ncbi:MAG: hypothetical protein R3F29_12590 [Planctomycetota bacterium]
MKTNLARLVCGSCLLAALPAQQPLRARSFLFDDHRTVMVADVKAMRDRGIWDDLLASPTRMLLPQLEDEIGFEMARLDRATITVIYDPDGGHRGNRQRTVTVLEGNAELGQPKLWPGNAWQEESVGSYTLYADTWSPEQAHVMVGDKLRVHAPVALLREVLAGKPHAGLPSADVLSLTSGARGLLAYAVIDVTNDWEPTETLDMALPDAQWPEGDRPTFVAILLRAIGDEDDPHLQLELVVRHALAGDGVVQSEAAIEAGFEKLRAMKESRLFRPILKRIEHVREGCDVTFSVDLGRSRDVMSMLATFAPMMMFATAAEAQVIQVEELVIEETEAVEEPPPPPPPENNGGGNGGN